MTWRRCTRDEDAGETLIEVIVSIAILAVIAVAIGSALTVSVLISDVHRKQATAGAYVRSYGEAIQATVAQTNGYVRCATASAYSSPANFTLPSSYVASVTKVEYLASITTGAWQGTCPAAGDLGAQRLSLRVTSYGTNVSNQATESLSIVVRNCVTTCS